MEAWQVALGAVAVIVLIGIIAWDTARAGAAGGRAYRAARKQSADDDHTERL